MRLLFFLKSGTFWVSIGIKHKDSPKSVYDQEQNFLGTYLWQLQGPKLEWILTGNLQL